MKLIVPPCFLLSDVVQVADGGAGNEVQLPVPRRLSLDDADAAVDEPRQPHGKHDDAQPLTASPPLVALAANAMHDGWYGHEKHAHEHGADTDDVCHR